MISFLLLILIFNKSFAHFSLKLYVFSRFCNADKRVHSTQTTKITIFFSYSVQNLNVIATCDFFIGNKIIF